MAQELIVLCDEKGNPTGTAEKLSAHNADTRRHLAFSCYVFNEQGRFLVTQRAKSKKVWSGVWTNSCCGHPAPGEETIEAIKRRLSYELGMSADKFEVVLPSYRYTTPSYNGVIENEFCPVYVARATTEPKLNPEEVEGFHWMKWDEYIAALESDSENVYSWWAKDQLKLIKSNSKILEYAKII